MLSRAADGFPKARQLFKGILDIDPINPGAQQGFAQRELGWFNLGGLNKAVGHL